MCRTRRSLERSARVTVKKNHPPSMRTRRYRDMVQGYHFFLLRSTYICCLRKISPRVGTASLRSALAHPTDVNSPREPTEQDIGSVQRSAERVRGLLFRLRTGGRPRRQPALLPLDLSHRHRG